MVLHEDGFQMDKEVHDQLVQLGFKSYNAPWSKVAPTYSQLISEAWAMVRIIYYSSVKIQIYNELGDYALNISTDKQNLFKWLNALGTISDIATKLDADIPKPSRRRKIPHKFNGRISVSNYRSEESLGDCGVIFKVLFEEAAENPLDDYKDQFGGLDAQLYTITLDDLIAGGTPEYRGLTKWEVYY